MPETEGSPILALDYDGVIADTNAAKARWIEQHVGLQLPVSKCNRTDCVPLIGASAYEEMSEHVYGRTATAEASELTGVGDAIRSLASSWRFILVTARTEQRLQFAEDWLFAHDLRPAFIDTMTSASGISKLDLASEYGAVGLVDDDERHLGGDGYPSVTRVLFRQEATPSKPRAWLYEGMIVVNSWTALTGLLRWEAATR